MQILFETLARTLALAEILQKVVVAREEEEERKKEEDEARFSAEDVDLGETGRRKKDRRKKDKRRRKRKKGEKR